MEHLEGITRGEGAHSVSAEVAERVRAVLSAAESAAVALRHEAEQDAQMRRRAVDEEARHMLEDARRDADAFLEERRRRISELSDTILERAEQIVARLDRADDVRRQLQELVDALGRTAEELAREATRAAPRPAGAEPVAPPTPEEPPIAETEPVPEPELAASDEAFGPGDAESPPDVVELPRTEAPEPPAPRRRVPEAEEDEDLAARLVALQMAVAGANRGEVASHLETNFALGDPSRILDDVFGRGSESDKRVTWPEAVRDTGS